MTVANQRWCVNKHCSVLRQHVYMNITSYQYVKTGVRHIHVTGTTPYWGHVVISSTFLDTLAKRQNYTYIGAMGSRARYRHQATQLLIYWAHNPEIMYPTLQMTKTYQKRRVFDDENDVFWVGFGFRKSGVIGLNGHQLY